MIFLFLNINISCGHSKKTSQWDGSFEHPKHILKLLGKKIFTILRSNILFIYTYEPTFYQRTESEKYKF